MALLFSYLIFDNVTISSIESFELLYNALLVLRRFESSVVTYKLLKFLRILLAYNIIVKRLNNKLPNWPISCPFQLKSFEKRNMDLARGQNARISIFFLYNIS